MEMMMTERTYEFADSLADILADASDNTIDALEIGERLRDLMGEMELLTESAKTFSQAGILTDDAGIVIPMGYDDRTRDRLFIRVTEQGGRW
jgi:hypothetical protein